MSSDRLRINGLDFLLLKVVNKSAAYGVFTFYGNTKVTLMYHVLQILI